MLPSGVDSWALWCSEGIGSPSVGVGSALPPPDGDGRWGRRGVARRRGCLAPGEEGLGELLPEVAEHAARVRPGVLAHALPRRLPEQLVVRVPAPDAIGEADQVLVHPWAALGEEPLERDPVRAVRLLAEQLPLYGRGELARRVPVVGVDDPVDDVRAEEREVGVASSRDGEVVEAHEVHGRPRGEQQDRDAGVGSRAREPRPPRARQQQRQQRRDQEHLVRRAREREQRRRDAGEREQAGRTGAALRGRPPTSRRRTRPRRGSRSPARGRPRRTRGRAGAAAPTRTAGPAPKSSAVRT